MRAIDYFDKQSETTPNRVALIDGERRYSYSDVRAASQRIARAMWSAGLRGEEPVAIYSTNDARVLFCMLGLLRAGGVWVPINFRNAADANVEYLNYVRTKWLFYHSTFRDQRPRTESPRPHVASRNLHRRARWRQPFARSLHAKRFGFTRCRLGRPIWKS